MFDKTISFIRELYRTEEFIPLHAPVFPGNEKKYLNECIDSTFVSSVGPFVDLFEKKTSEYTGSKRAVVMVNGTEALHLSLIMAGVKQGDEVITQPLTFIATVNAISYTGAVPVFVDVDLETMGMSPDSLLEFLDTYCEVRDDGKCYNRETGNRISACVPMHTFGHPARIDSIAAICLNYNIPLIEDAAESIGSTFKGRHTGTFGRMGILSFNGNKIITTGGGGMILTDDEELGKLAKYLSTQAKVPHAWEFYHDRIGYNYRMPNINAALGVAQLENLDAFIESKRYLASCYQLFFKEAGIRFFTEPEFARSNYWLNVVMMKDLEERNDFLEETNKKGVMTRPAWTLATKLPMFQQCLSTPLPNALWLEDRVVNIPSSVLPA